jgi:hypothetical protein
MSIISALSLEVLQAFITCFNSSGVNIGNRLLAIFGISKVILSDI